MRRPRGAAASGTLAALTMVAACGSGTNDVAAHPVSAPAAPSSAAPLASSVPDSGAAKVAATAPPVPRLPADAPVVLTGTHTPIGSVWLPNGHLFVATSSETLEIDPEHVDAPWRVRPPLRDEPPLALIGNGGTDRFLVIDAKGVTIWDAATLTLANTLPVAANFSKQRTLADRFSGFPVTISRDGSRVATVESRDAAALTIWDAHTAAVIAKIAPAETDDVTPDRISLGDDGTVATMIAADHVAVVDVASGKTIVRRDLPRTVSRAEGNSVDVCEVHGDRVLVSSRSGLEVIDRASGKVRAHTRNAGAMAANIVTISADGSKFLFGGFAWDAVHGGPVVAAPKALRQPYEERWRFEPLMSLRTDGHFFTLARGAGLEIDDDAGHAILRFGEARPDLYSNARTLALSHGVVSSQRNGPTQSDGPDAKDDVVFGAGTVSRPALPRAYADAWEKIESETHAFAIVGHAKPFAVVAWDGQGHEVFRHPIAHAMRLDAADGAVVIAVDKTSALRCGQAGCAPLPKPYATVRSLRDPWAVAQLPLPRRDFVVTNVRTGEERAQPSECAAGTERLIGADPSFACTKADGSWMVVRPEGARAIPLPAIAAGDKARIGFVGVDAGRLYFDLARDDFGLERGFRFDVAHGSYAQLYAVDRGGVVQYEDGTIERFGDRDAAAAVIRCPSDAGWAPYASCAAKWETAGRFEDANR